MLIITIEGNDLQSEDFMNKVVRDPALVVAPTRVNFGKLIVTLLVFPSPPTTKSIVKSSIAG